ISSDGTYDTWNGSGDLRGTGSIGRRVIRASIDKDSGIVAATAGAELTYVWSDNGGSLEILAGQRGKGMGWGGNLRIRRKATGSDDDAVVLWDVDFGSRAKIASEGWKELVVGACDMIGAYLKSSEGDGRPERFCEATARER